MRGCSVEVSDHILHVSPPVILEPPQLSPYAPSATPGFKHTTKECWEVEFKGADFTPGFLIFMYQKEAFSRPYLSLSKFSCCYKLRFIRSKDRLFDPGPFTLLRSLRVQKCAETLSEVSASSLERHDLGRFFLSGSALVSTDLSGADRLKHLC